VLSDRGAWLSFKNKGDLVIVVEGDKRLFNQYGVMLVNPQKHPNVKKGTRSAIHRLAGLGRGPEGNRRLQDQRRATVLPQRQRPERIMRTQVLRRIGFFCAALVTLLDSASVAQDGCEKFAWSLALLRS
jgi:hypothetical protein